MRCAHSMYVNVRGVWLIPVIFDDFYEISKNNITCAKIIGEQFVNIGIYDGFNSLQASQNIWGYRNGNIINGDLNKYTTVKAIKSIFLTPRTSIPVSEKRYKSNNRDFDFNRKDMRGQQVFCTVDFI